VPNSWFVFNLLAFCHLIILPRLRKDKGIWRLVCWNSRGGLKEQSPRGRCSTGPMSETALMVGEREQHLLLPWETRTWKVHPMKVIRNRSSPGKRTYIMPLKRIYSSPLLAKKEQTHCNARIQISMSTTFQSLEQFHCYSEDQGVMLFYSFLCSHFLSVQLFCTSFYWD
jgi:hypothetical protein